MASTTEAFETRAKRLGLGPAIDALRKANLEVDRLKITNAQLLEVCEALRDRYHPYGSPSEGTNRIYTMACAAVNAARSAA